MSGRVDASRLPPDWQGQPHPQTGAKTALALMILGTLGLIGYAASQNGWTKVAKGVAAGAVAGAVLSFLIYLHLRRPRNVPMPPKPVVAAPATRPTPEIFEQFKVKYGFEGELEGLVQEARAATDRAALQHVQRVVDELLQGNYSQADARLILRYALKATPWRIEAAFDTFDRNQAAVQENSARYVDAQGELLQGRTQPMKIVVDEIAYKRRLARGGVKGEGDERAHALDLVLSNGEFVPPTYRVTSLNLSGYQIQPFVSGCALLNDAQLSGSTNDLPSPLVHYNLFGAGLRANTDGHGSNLLVRAQPPALYDIDEEDNMPSPGVPVLLEAFGLAQAAQLCSRAMLMLMANPVLPRYAERFVARQVGANTSAARASWQLTADKAQAFVSRLQIMQTLARIELRKPQSTFSPLSGYFLLFGREMALTKFEDLMQEKQGYRTAAWILYDVISRKRTDPRGCHGLQVDYSDEGHEQMGRLIAFNERINQLEQGAAMELEVTDQIDFADYQAALVAEPDSFQAYPVLVAHFLRGNAKQHALAALYGVQRKDKPRHLALSLREEGQKHFLVITNCP